MTRINVGNIRHPDASTDSISLNSSGNVGIGGTSPGAQLDVRGSSTGDAKIRLDENGSFQAALQLRGNDLEIRGSSGTIEFYRGNNNEASSTEIARFDGSGRLLVGTSTSGKDSAKLQIAGGDNTNHIELLNTTASDTNGQRYSYVWFRGRQSGGEESSLAFIGAVHDGSSDDEKGRLIFHTNDGNDGDSPTERMRITSDGYVSIGGAVTSPANPLVIDRYGDGSFSPTSSTEQVSKAGLIVNPDSNNSSAIFSVAKHSTGATLLQASNGSGSSVYNLVACPFGSSFMVGTTATPSSSVTGVQITTGSFPRLVIATGDATSNQLVQFINTNGQVGNISTSGSSTSYNTSSDYRLKENIVDLDGAITRVKQLAPKRFNFIADETDTLVDGFLAHEAQTVVPEAVTGTHNEVDDDGNAVMQGIDQSKLVPLLTAALQEAIAKIETLEAKVAALEGG